MEFFLPTMWTYYPAERTLAGLPGYRWARDPRDTAIWLITALLTFAVAALLALVPSLLGENAVVVWLIVALITLFGIGRVVMAIVRSKRIVRSATGSPLRRRHSVAYPDGGSAAVDDVVARFRSGDPAQHAPMPDGHLNRGQLRVQIWTADADRLGLVAVQRGNEAPELIDVDGPAYDRMSEALERGIGRWIRVRSNSTV
ncbi:hypothetical protein GCM10027515_06310 [Schumannella luteola]|uniref:Uncharacterized protein n=1 Tax=Schumannella luteola TaxID=472059 RepID=A0A852YEV1_9MICO|nr:hypothetical protein [Schumannella luteola]NYG98237.1 hypothetical protein [Schumannella luteola]TPX02148.1 hypothetical protein FJ656_23870 [Schumannella luteola]